MTETQVKTLEYFLDSYISFPHTSKYLEHDINVDYYDGLNIEDTLSIYELGYKNLENVSFVNRSLLFNIIDYIRLNPDSFFVSQIELIVFVLHKKPILIFRNHNNVCDRCLMIDVDKILEEDNIDFKFLKESKYGYGKILTGILFLGLISTLVYYKIKVKK
jgi:hypothetical protein